MGGTDLRLLLDDVFLFVGILTAMGCFTGIVVSLIKRRKAVATPEVIGRLDEIAERLARLENAVDATSVEIERISEAQRFTTKLLAERVPTPLVAERDRKASH